MGKSQGFKPGDHKFLLELPPDLNLDLHAFCALHFGAPKAEVIRRALRRLFDAETSDPRSAAEFNEIRRQLREQSGVGLRVIPQKRISRSAK